MANKVRSESPANYGCIPSSASKAAEDKVIQSALDILRRRYKRDTVFASPSDSINYLKLHCANYEHEVFGIIHLDNRNRVIDIEELFQGTIDGCSVYPRQVVKSVLQHNAAAILLFHNHPSGVAEPSQADIAITHRLKTALATIDVRILDHIIVAGDDNTSFNDRGLI